MTEATAEPVGVVVQAPFQVFAGGVCYLPGDTVVGATDDELALWRQAGWVD